MNDQLNRILTDVQHVKAKSDQIITALNTTRTDLAATRKKLQDLQDGAQNNDEIITSEQLAGVASDLEATDANLAAAIENATAPPPDSNE